MAGPAVACLLLKAVTAVPAQVYDVVVLCPTSAQRCVAGSYITYEVTVEVEVDTVVVDVIVEVYDVKSVVVLNVVSYRPALHHSRCKVTHEVANPEIAVLHEQRVSDSRRL